MKAKIYTFNNLSSEAEQTVLSGDVNSENTLENQQNVAQVYTAVRVQNSFDYAAPAISLTAIRVKAKK